MLFKKDIPKCCELCENAIIKEDENCFCNIKKKVVTPDFKCRKFSYDIFKKKIIKNRQIDFSKYSKEDFTL